MLCLFCFYPNKNITTSAFIFVPMAKIVFIHHERDNINNIRSKDVLNVLYRVFSELWLHYTFTISLHWTSFHLKKFLIYLSYQNIANCLSWIYISFYVCKNKLCSFNKTTLEDHNVWCAKYLTLNLLITSSNCRE